MKTYEYLVYFKNGKKEYFYGMGFQQIIVAAMHWANDHALNPEIEKIVNEHNVTITNIQISYDVV